MVALHKNILNKGYYIAISDCLALLGFGRPSGILVNALSDSNLPKFIGIDSMWPEREKLMHEECLECYTFCCA